jgi:hypothetical protein
MNSVTLYLFFDSELRTDGEPNWVGMLRLIRKEAKTRKEEGLLHTFAGISYLPAHNAGYIAFTVKFK